MEEVDFFWIGWGLVGFSMVFWTAVNFKRVHRKHSIDIRCQEFDVWSNQDLNMYIDELSRLFVLNSITDDQLLDLAAARKNYHKRNGEVCHGANTQKGNDNE